MKLSKPKDVKELHQISDTGRDTISSLKFSEAENYLLVTSWDKVRIFIKNYYNNKTAYIHQLIINQNDNISDSVIFQQSFPHPQLDSCFDSNSLSQFYTVGLDCELKLTNIEVNSTFSIGTHKAPINKVILNSAFTNQVITSGWDKQIKFWDRGAGKPLVHTLEADMTITGLLLVGNRLVMTGSTDFTKESNFNLNSHLIKVYDIRNLSSPEESYESVLKNETISFCGINPSEGFILGGPEGKISVEFFKDLDPKNSTDIKSNTRDNGDTNPMIKQSYAFKCHREEIEGRSVIHSISALAYHPRYNLYLQNILSFSLSIYISGGTDRQIFAWDNIKRKKIYKSFKYPNTITNLAFNSDGKYLAIASSNIYENLEFPDEEFLHNSSVKDVQRESPKIFIQAVSSFL